MLRYICGTLLSDVISTKLFEALKSNYLKLQMLLWSVTGAPESGLHHSVSAAALIAHYL